MKAILEFQLPEDQSDFEDYQKGRKLLYFMQQWIQDAKWTVEKPGFTGHDLLENLKQAIADENIELL
jgi:hypothetical protein